VIKVEVPEVAMGAPEQGEEEELGVEDERKREVKAGMSRHIGCGTAEIR